MGRNTHSNEGEYPFPTLNSSPKIRCIEMEMKLLVVDDDRRVRKMIASLAAEPMDEVIECSDGSEAYFAYAQNLPDWVLMDLMMPDLDGIAATRQIVSSYPHAKVIIVTSHESSAMRERARNAGACGYVLKENLSELREIITANQRV